MSNARPRILIIDDDQAIRYSLKKILGDAGFAVEVAADGRDGLAQLKHERFDLLLLDLNLPELSGFDVLDEAHDRGPFLPVIVLTGLLDQCEPGALIGADLIVEKPPEASFLLQAISDLLNEPPVHRLRRLSSIHSSAHAVSASRFRRLAHTLAPPPDSATNGAASGAHGTEI